jgi:hypothetical protein
VLYLLFCQLLALVVIELHGTFLLFPYICIQIRLYVTTKKEQLYACLLRVELGDELAAALDHVVTVDGVEYLLTLFAAGHKTKLLENIQMVGDGWLRHVENVHNVTDALFFLRQYHQDTLPGVVSQSLAELYAIDRHDLLLNL